MVNVPEIDDHLQKYFKVLGSYNIDPDSGVVDVHGDVRLKLQCAQMPVQFGVVDGSFVCSEKGLTTLQGAPQQCTHNFECDHNNLTSLQYAPHHVGSFFICSSNLLTSLAHAPRTTQGFLCADNKLTSLLHGPQTVFGAYFCNDNPLESLAGAPEKLSGAFWCTPGHDLPILRLCMYDKLDLDFWDPKLADIMKKYAGTGKPGAIKCAAELIRAGFKGNARW